jgi:hypothetical protein
MEKYKEGEVVESQVLEFFYLVWAVIALHFSHINSKKLWWCQGDTMAKEGKFQG